MPALLAFARHAWLPTCASVLAGLLAWSAVAEADSMLSTAITLLFVVLFALTVPHLAIQEAYKRLRPLGTGTHDREWSMRAAVGEG